MLAFAVVVASLLFAMRPPTEMSEPQFKPITVDVAEVVREDLRVQIQAQGTVSPLRSSSLLAEVSGRIVEVADHFNVGGFVAEGDMLLRVDPRDYETNLLRARAAVESAESALAQERGRAQVAEREWKKLPAGSQRSDEARDLYLRKPQLEQAESQLLAAQADLNTAQDNLDRTVVRAPYAALIKAKHSDLGQFVATGSPLADIFAIEAAEVRLPIPQSRLDFLELPEVNGDQEGSVIDLYTDVGGVVKHWTAHLQRTEGVFDERSRALYAVARIDDPYGLHRDGRDPLRVGTFVNANITGRELRDVIALPRYLLRAGNSIWVINEDNLLRNRSVTTLRTGGDVIYIRDGLEEGELVSLTLLDSSFEGSEVIIQSRTPTNALDEHGKPRAPEATQDVTASVVEESNQPEG